jgi:hypothetical protein
LCAYGLRLHSFVYGFELRRQRLYLSDNLHSLPTGTQSGSCDPVLKRVCG